MNELNEWKTEQEKRKNEYGKKEQTKKNEKNERK